MHRNANERKQVALTFDNDELFEDSSILANFNNSSFMETNAGPSRSDSVNRSNLNVSALCCDEEIQGYDKLTGQTWIYPTNYPVRDYQFNIIKAAILKNTLVSLPTGLGKTFIAAVIMYNFYRWYPLGKIVFTAPTRPLVAQQIEACYNIIAIPPGDTIEMTGHMQVSTRKAHWQTKRVFFATPQVIYNDIKSGICPSEKIRCLVIDEAHRARGNYAYCQIVATLTDMGCKTYRLLALSATPGSKVEDVVNVVKNLHIAHLELRTENCIDVAPYSHARRINTVIVQLGPELSQLRQHYVEVLDGYARRLKQLNILPHNLGNLSKGRIVMLYKEFQNKEHSARHAQHNYIMKDFTMLIALYHGLELLIKHGTRVFLNFFDEHPEKSWIQADDRLTALLERLRDDLGINPLALNTSMLPDGTIPEIPKNLSFGHPKFYKLKEIMLQHFNNAKEKGQDTRAIVFCEYRESVNLVNCMLLQCRPLITPQMFVGQGASGKDGKTVVSQKQQLRVMRNFRDGACNTLVATCVAEEGLDVGSVDLILCFDISTRSPIRLVQRCGRTGRERGGQVYILVTEGREHQTLVDCIRQRDGLNKKILQSRDVLSNLYALNPRMMPHDFMPQCQKMFITVEKKMEVKQKDGNEKNKKNQKDLRIMLLGRASSSSSSSSKEIEAPKLISQEEFNEIYPSGYQSTSYFAEPKEFCSMSRETLKIMSLAEEPNALKLSTWLEWQRTLQKTVNIGHSKDSEILASLLQYSDAKRFDMPASTQHPCFNTQDFATQKFIATSPVKISSPAKTSPAKAKPKKKQKIPLFKSPSKKDGDIRALFSTATKSTKNYTKLINDLGVSNDGSIPTRLINLLVDLSLDKINSLKPCYVCQSIYDCGVLKKSRKHEPTLPLTFIKTPKFPNIDLIDDIDADSILKCVKSNYDNEISVKECESEVSYLNLGNKSCNNFDLEFDFDSPIDLTFSDNEINKNDKCPEKNFDIGDIDDIFAESPPEEINKEPCSKKEDTEGPKDTLGFFGLDSIDDIFADSDDDKDSTNRKVVTTPKKILTSQVTIKKPISPKVTVSPSILSGKQSNIPTSPILCSQVRKFSLSIKKKNQPQCSTPINNVKRCLIPDTNKNITTASSKIQNSAAETSNKSMFTITQLVDMINKTEINKSALSNSTALDIPSKVSDYQTVKEDERSKSPIFLTQTDKKRNLNNGKDNNLSQFFNSNPGKCDSLIILESSDSENETQSYDVDDVINDICSQKEKSTALVAENTSEPFKTPVKRKLEEDSNQMINSPYFNKKQKLNNNTSKPLTLQEKVLAALTSNKMSDQKSNIDCNINFVLSPQKNLSQKENNNPQFLNYKKQNNSDDKKEFDESNIFNSLQRFKRDVGSKCKYRAIVESPGKVSTNNKKRRFDDSNDDFVDTEHYRSESINNDQKTINITNHKVRKKKKTNSLLDLEAELDDEHDSGDEMSDESIGSIIDFICDDDVTHHDDMQAHYMKSVKSPVKGVFKIPQLPKKYDNDVIFSQYVEEDSYEMDSFCVDSHIGLTQVNDLSELEAAEIILEERKSKRKRKPHTNDPQENGDSPLVRQKNRKVKRRIESDSDDSS